MLFREPLGAEGNIAPSNLPRRDLVTAFLTGLEGLNQLSTVTPSEMLRLNTAIPATAAEAQASLGAVAGDLAGFPNGRRPGDDVTDIALRVVMGALCHPIGVDLDGSGAAGDGGDTLGLCEPSDAPVGNAPLTDGVGQSAMQFETRFPYLTTPLAGSPGGGSGAVPPPPPMPTDPMPGDGDMMSGDETGDDCPVDAGDFIVEASSTELELLWDEVGGGVIGYDVFVDGRSVRDHRRADDAARRAGSGLGLLRRGGAVRRRRQSSRLRAGRHGHDRRLSAIEVRSRLAERRRVARRTRPGARGSFVTPLRRSVRRDERAC